MLSKVGRSSVCRQHQEGGELGKSRLRKCKVKEGRRVTFFLFFWLHVMWCSDGFLFSLSRFASCEFDHAVRFRRLSSVAFFVVFRFDAPFAADLYWLSKLVLAPGEDFFFFFLKDRESEAFGVGLVAVFQLLLLAFLCISSFSTTSIPGPPNRWFLVVFGYLKASRNHLLGGTGSLFVLPFSLRCQSPLLSSLQSFRPQRILQADGIELLEKHGFRWWAGELQRCFAWDGGK